MQDQLIQAALGGLLHDLGKFAQRAGVKPNQMWDAEAERDYRYQHALLSADLARELLPGPWPEAIQGVTYHHRPEHGAAKRVARLVAVGDRLSSGERTLSAEAEPQQMLPVFARVFSSDRAPALEGAYLPLQPLRMTSEAIFSQAPASREQIQTAYGSLWNAFLRAAKGLAQIEDGPTLVSQIMLLLLEYAWCVPAAAWHAIPDVSLYDHSRMTAALAACLASRDDAVLDSLLADPEEQDAPVALLVGGDVSGIQDFIYTITPRGATPALRGRSLYVQLLTEAAAHYVLRALDLPATNLVYAGGGHFYLLAPVGAEPALAEAQRTISRALLSQHGGDLYLAVAHRTLVAREFFKGGLSTAWDELGGQLRRAKDRRFAELERLHQLLFTPRRDQGNWEKECQVCHQEHIHTRREGDWKKCPMCLSFEALGDELRTARYLLVEQIEPAPVDDDAPAGDAHTALAHLGARVSLHERVPASDNGPACRSVLYALDDEALAGLVPGPRRAVGRKLLVNVTPRKYDQETRRERVAANDELARASRGIERLGVLRMDVDNLGQIFRQGLGPAASLSRIAALSLAISLYFEGYVETLARGLNPEGAEHTAYSIYSGGDDLFFVGAWDRMLELAQSIRSEFGRYTGGHPRLHLSGGLALVDAHYPLYRAAEEAKEGEDAAKEVEGKNAFAFLGQALPWPVFARAATLAQQLDALVQSGRAPRALPRLLMRAQEAHDAIARQRTRDGADRTATGDPQGYYGPWIPRLEYALARMAERYRDITAELEEIRTSLREDNYAAIQWIGLAARWAELLNRTHAREEHHD